MRAVLDPNVLISAMLSPAGTPALLLREWHQGRFELVVSPLLLEELERALAYPKLRRLVDDEDARGFSAWLRNAGTLAEDPHEMPPIRSSDPGDDYLLALAVYERATLVSGDRHLLDLAQNYFGAPDELPIFSPGSFLEFLDREGKQ